MIRLRFQVHLAYEVLDPLGADFIFNIHPARTSAQSVHGETLKLSQDAPHALQTDARTGMRLLRLHAGKGPLELEYGATVEIAHHRVDPASLAEAAVRDLPMEALEYLYPSRYCQSDRLATFAMREFGELAPGYGRVEAIRQWVLQHVSFASNTSTGTTSAVDTLIERVGVCRDFAHLMIALCRAVSIPARMATGTDYGADEKLGPPDFHAYVECYLGGRWYIFDPSGTSIPMGLIRLGTGRDAADVAFATIFGAVETGAPRIRCESLHEQSPGCIAPVPCEEALSTAE